MPPRPIKVLAQPSRFVDELDVPAPPPAEAALGLGSEAAEAADAAGPGAGAEPVVVRRHVQGRPRRPLSMAGLVAELRRTLADPDQPEPLRRAAARRLRQLADTDVHGRRWSPASADPGDLVGAARAEPLRAAGPRRRTSR